MKWTDELVGKFAEMHRFSSGRTSMNQFKQMVDNPSGNDAEWIKVLKYEDETPQPKELFTRGQMIGFAEWIEENKHFENYVKSAKQLLDLYLSQSNKGTQIK